MTIKAITTPTLMKTMTLLTDADSLMPTISSVVTARMPISAGRLKVAITCVASAGTAPFGNWFLSKYSPLRNPPTTCPGAAVNSGGMLIPRSCRKLTT
ncbi:MAG: hypothetical protein A3E78_17275 [Alphaproteobacteria bacterium RIFCSPHIGHO2_12_FULL_63_12]|nr:MAG: hypothetical protein A3E78_17275 [Alphaproteobacteria bacterium RIFCSPHIGHO2_12_FULL_63_12]